MRWGGGSYKWAGSWDLGFLEYPFHSQTCCKKSTIPWFVAIYQGQLKVSLVGLEYTIVQCIHYLVVVSYLCPPRIHRYTFWLVASAILSAGTNIRATFLHFELLYNLFSYRFVIHLLIFVISEEMSKKFKVKDKTSKEE